jgi:hypothetical protein
VSARADERVDVTRVVAVLRCNGKTEYGKYDTTVCNGKKEFHDFVLSPEKVYRKEISFWNN